MTLRDDLEQLRELEERPNPYEKYHLLENPFPAFGEVPSDVCVDQDHIKVKFRESLRGFGAGAKRIRIDGESGAGKTNILRYFVTLTDRARTLGYIARVYPIYVSAPGDSYFAVHEQIISSLTGAFLSDVVGTLQLRKDLPQSIVDEYALPPELIEALASVARPPGALFDLYEERRRDIFVRWLKGRKVSVQDKRFLGNGLPDIGSASLAIHFLGGLLRLLKGINLTDGIVLLFDEFEEIFESLTRTQHSRYAQDLRHLLDSLQEDVLFVVATTPNPRDLGQYPAITRRLGKELLLQPIENEDVALTYVREYMYAGHVRYSETPEKPVLSPEERESLAPLTGDEIAQEFRTLQTEVTGKNLNVLPGYFLPRMRALTQRLVEAGNP